MGHTLDSLAEYNKARWEELARAGVMYSRPMMDLNRDSARRLVDPEGKMDAPAGRDVLCLAGGGGQQSAAFGLLGATVTVLDLCETQLQRDREAADHYGHAVRTVQGDMRDLSCFDRDSFDLVWHAHSLNFVPDAGQVFDQVTRVLRPGGQYRLSCWNPFAHGVCEAGWTGRGYTLSHTYVEAAEMPYDDPFWEFAPWQGAAPVVEAQASGDNVRIRGPREFRHTIGTLVNELIERGFVLLGLWEDDPGDADAEPGTWDHFKAYAPPWLTIWARQYGRADTPPFID